MSSGIVEVSTRQWRALRSTKLGGSKPLRMSANVLWRKFPHKLIYSTLDGNLAMVAIMLWARSMDLRWAKAGAMIHSRLVRLFPETLKWVM